MSEVIEMQGIEEGKVFSRGDLENIRNEANKIMPELELETVEMYPHEGGVLVAEREGKQWVYFHGKDGTVSYDWALWKILGRLKRAKGG